MIHVHRRVEEALLQNYKDQNLAHPLKHQSSEEPTMVESLYLNIP